MDVYFKAEASNRLVTNLPDGTQVIFNKGLFSTTNKDIVKHLLRSDIMKRRLVKLETDEVSVARWLENDEEPSFITPEFVKDLSNECLLVLGNKLNTVSKVPTVIREELVGSPLTTEIMEIVDAYKQDAKQLEESATTGLTDEDVLINKSIEDGIIIREGVWYKTKDGTNIGRKREDVVAWLKQPVED